MARVLVLFAHPALEKSRVHRRLLREPSAVAGVTVHDLYEQYPQFAIDVKREQALLEAHDVVVVQHPFYWYSTPPLVKQWEDLVLEHGWAYGSRGTKLAGKRWLSVISTGGGAAAYGPGSFNRFTVRELLRPIEQTAVLCGMTFLPPLLFQGTHHMRPEHIETAARLYRHALELLVADRLPLAGAELEAESLNAVLAQREGHP
jgi:glutathione-regulated potassium-efflux system ancillary protein KefG